MNKKFSTFLAGVALLGVTFSANAQANWKEYQALRDVSANTPVKVGSYTKNTSNLYVLSVAADQANPATSAPTTSVLGLDANGKFVINNVSNTLADFDGKNLWCVDVTTSSADNRTYTYSFLNKGKSEYLGIDVDNALKGLLPNTVSTTDVYAGIELTGWSLSNNLSNMQAGAIYSTLTYNRDSVVGLVLTGTNVRLKKASLADAMAGNAGFTNFVMSTLNDIRLNKDELNSLLFTKTNADGFTLIFNPDTKGVENPFTGKTLVAGDYFTTSAAGHGNVIDFDQYVTVRDKDGNYLVVDTAYYNTTGDRYLKYAWYSKDKVEGSSVLEPRANFAFTYNPSTDQVYIQVQEVSFINQVTPGGADVKPNWNAAIASTDTTIYANPYVARQDLLDQEIILLSLNADQNTEIKLGLGGCEPGTDRVTLVDDLYVITDGKRYLAVPIHGDSIPQWVDIEVNTDPWQMPAYQWVVERTQRTPTTLPASPVKISNREFTDVTFVSPVQFYDGDYTANVVVVNKNKLTDAANIGVKKSFFQADPDNYKANKYLGYNRLDTAALRVTSYKFRYHHGLSDDTFLGGDSILAVGGAAASFKLDTATVSPTLASTEIKYGYTTTNIPTMAQLVRQVYTMTIKNSDKKVGHAKDHKYTVSKWNTKNAPIDEINNNQNIEARFYFKTNNVKDGVLYYALVDTFGYYGMTPDSVRKAAINDNSLILEGLVMTSPRTSAFAIEIDDSPIYRRFGTDPAEGVEKNDDETIAMRFVEEYRGEALMVEYNKNFVKNPDKLDYAGIDRPQYAKSGLAITVDTAWVQRGLGYIKPQYLLSIENRDYAGRDIQLCQETFHGYAEDGRLLTAEECPHTIQGAPAFERRKYMVNLNRVYANYTTEEVIWRNNYDRVGFVHAIREKDSLYVLSNKAYDFYAKDFNETLDLKVIKAEAAKTTGTRNVTRYILSGDNHKPVTWSMRYVDIDNLDTNNSFLIESRSQNDATWIQPTNAQWLKMNNGCLVLSDEDATFNEMTGISTIDDVLIFNVEYAENDPLATDNDKVTTTEVKVIAAEGKVTVLNAAGKKVVVSNILGQTVANTVLSSDNASIAAPKGIVVVAVEGEEAVKAIVK